jgi:hypothetical protein
MAKATFDKWFKGLRGKVGELIYRLMPDGSTVVSRAPKNDTLDFSEGQLNHQNRFRQAAFYARHAAQDQPIYAELAAATAMRTAYNFALSDWWHAPVIHCIERREGRVLIEATDNVMVAKVQVTILDEEGQALEKGEATKAEGNWWEFTSNAEGKTLIAEAWDLPNHMTKFVVE